MRVSFAGVVVQIVLLDLVFSIDSVITAVGMARALSIMVAGAAGHGPSRGSPPDEHLADPPERTEPDALFLAFSDSAKMTV